MRGNPFSWVRNRVQAKVAAEYASKPEGEILQEFLALSIEQDAARDFADTRFGRVLGGLQVAVLAVLLAAMPLVTDAEPARLVRVALVLAMVGTGMTFMKWPFLGGHWFERLFVLEGAAMIVAPWLGVLVGAWSLAAHVDLIWTLSGFGGGYLLVVGAARVLFRLFFGEWPRTQARAERSA